MYSEKDFEREAAKREAEHDSISNYLDKQKRIKKEVNRLKKLFKEL